MNSLEAIIGLGIVNELLQHIEKRYQNMIKISNLLGKKCFPERENEYIVPHCFPVLLRSKEIRDKFLKLLPEKYGVEARQIFYSIPTQSEAYRFSGEKEGAYPIAEDIGRRGIYVPCHQNLSDENITKISNILKEISKNE